MRDGEGLVLVEQATEGGGTGADRGSEADGLWGGWVPGSDVELSVCGIEFTVSAPEELFPVDAVLTSVISAGSFKLAGEIAVRVSRATGDGLVEVGGLFYPSSQEVEQVLAVLVAGIEAAQPADPTDS